MKKRVFLALALCATFAQAAVVAMAAGAGEPLPYKHFDLGVGSYGSGYSWGGGTVLDIARYDWAMVTFGNESDNKSTPERLNRELEINPDLKILVRLWPKPGYRRSTDDPKANKRYIGFLDYLYYPEAKAEFIKAALGHLHLVLDNVSKPENVYGATLFEELPHQFGGDVSILEKTASGTPVNDYVIQFKEFYEKETGKRMTEWNRDVRVWWGQKFSQALHDVYATIKKDSPKIRLFVWFMSHYRLLDWLEPGEDVHTPKVIPCYWKDLIQPGVAADGFFAYANNAFWAKRYQDLARKNRWPYFSQLSHSGGMRIGSWEECRAIAKADLPENLGYFYYSPDFTYGHWNDDPDVAEDDRPDLSAMYNRTRQYLAKEEVGMDIVRRHLAPQAVLSHDLGETSLKNFSMVTATVTNRRTTKWFLSEDEATLRNVKIKVTVPPEFIFPENVSVGPEVTIPEIKPGETKTVMLWARRERETPAGVALPASLEVSADGVEPVKVSSTEPVSNPVPQEQFEAKRSGDKFTYVNWGLPWGKQPVEITVECIYQCMSLLKNPTLRIGTRQMTFNGIMQSGDKLVIEPGMKATLMRGKEKTDVSDKLEGEELKISKGVTCFEYLDDYADGGSAKARISFKCFPQVGE